MDSQVTWQLIRLRLQDGRLPPDRAVELSFAPGSGQVCDTEDWCEMRFHDECFHIWDDERLKDPQSGRVRSTPAKKHPGTQEGGAIHDATTDFLDHLWRVRAGRF